jgi:hypothetical protein
LSMQFSKSNKQACKSNVFHTMVGIINSFVFGLGISCKDCLDELT